MSDVQFPSNPALSHGGLSALLASEPKAIKDALLAKSSEKAAKDFESVLLHKVLEEMKRTIPESGLLQTPISGQIQDLFWFYLAQDLAGKGGLGVWKDLHGQMNAAGPQRGTPSVEQPS